MRTFIIALVVLIILLSAVGYYIGYLNKTEENLSHILDEISAVIQKENWDEIEVCVDLFLENWEKNETVLSMFNDHEEIDEIRLSASNLYESVLYRDKEHTKKEVEKLRILLDRLKKNETLSLENVLSLSQCGLSCHIML